MIFKRQKPQSFHYEPRYYDARQDADYVPHYQRQKERSRQRLSQPMKIRLVTLVLLLLMIFILVASR